MQTRGHNGSYWGQFPSLKSTIDLLAVEASGDGIPGHVPSDQIIMKPPTHGAEHTHCINEACGSNGHSFFEINRDN